MFGGNCHVTAKQVAPASPETIAPGIGKHKEVQKPLIVSLRAYICQLLLLWLRLEMVHPVITCCPHKITNEIKILSLFQTFSGFAELVNFPVYWSGIGKGMRATRLPRLVL